MTWLLFVLAALATIRVTRLITGDYITSWFRDGIGRTFGKAEDGGRLHYLVTCDWCTSMYVGPGLVTLAVLWPTNTAVWIILGGLAASAVAGLASKLDQ